MKNHNKIKKRKRLSRPLTLILVAIALIAFPFVNLLALAWQYGIPLGKIHIAILSIDIIALALLLPPLPIGFGLLYVKKWAWWSLLVYTSLLIVYNVYVAVGSPAGFNYLALLQSAVGMGALIFFLQKNMSAPYFKMHPRGWRGQKRNPIKLPLKLADVEHQMIDLSLTGLYANWPNCDLVLNSEISIDIQAKNEKSILLKGGVVRVDPDGAGIAFRDLQMPQMDRLKQLLA